MEQARACGGESALNDQPIRFELDYSLAMSEAIGPKAGLSGAELRAEEARATEAVRAILRRTERGELGFFHASSDQRVVEEIEALLPKLPAHKEVIVLGIGGSSLGARALIEALRGPHALHEPSEDAPRLHFPDNSDPFLLSALLKRLDPKDVLLIVASKSGGTIETAASFLIAREFIRSALGEEALRSRTIVITDPEQGVLRALAREEGLHSLPIPSNIGGRFSVLTAMGLLPAALARADLRRILEGADWMRSLSEKEALNENPAALYAALHYLHHLRHGRPIHVLMPYADALRPFAAWYVQLWAESLGKRLSREGELVEIGPTPLPAIGATDQHAQVQLFMEGPRDKLITFLELGEAPSDLTIPHEEGPFEYLGGLSMKQILDAERRGTSLALASDGRPNLTLRIPRLDEAHLGALFFFFEAATAFAGELYEIDAFNQPGVEKGKVLASAILKRPGFGAQRAEIEAMEARSEARHSLVFSRN